MSWLFYTACMGAHLPAVELDNMIWFGTYSRVLGFLWHGSKWARQFVRFLHYMSGLEVLACRIYNNFNLRLQRSNPRPQGLNMFLSQQVFCSELDKESLVLLRAKNSLQQKHIKALETRVLCFKLVCSHALPKTSSDN